MWYLFIITRRASLLNDFVTSLNRLGLLQPMEYEGGIIDWVDQAILYTHLSPGGDEKDRAIKELEEQRRRELRSLGVRTATSLVELQVRDPGTRRVLESWKLDPDALALVQEAIKSNDNFALVRRWRCLTASSLNAPNGSKQVVLGNGHQLPTLTMEA